MDMWVIKKVNGGYVAKAGSEKAYTPSLEKARKFPSKAAAEADACVENEVVLPVESLLW
jgi:hypothetical protein